MALVIVLALVVTAAMLLFKGWYLVVCGKAHTVPRWRVFLFLFLPSLCILSAAAIIVGKLLT